MKLGIGLLRVSTDQQYQEGHGIESQKSRCDYYAQTNDITIVRYFIEHYSGRKSDRFVFDDILAFIKAHKDEISALVVGNIDRFTRAGAETYLSLQRMLREEGIELLDASGVIQKPVNTLEHLGVEYEWSVRSPSRLSEVLVAENANSEVSNILTRCIGSQIKVARMGYQFGPSNYGYRNSRETLPQGKVVSVMIAHEQEAPFMRLMFELRAEGILSDQEICDKLNAMGFRTRQRNRFHPETRVLVGKSGGNLLDPKLMQAYIGKPIYCGLRAGKWTNNEFIKIPYDMALVSIQQFNQANRGKLTIIENSNGYELINERDRYARCKDTSEFQLRHIVVCEACNKPLLGSKSRSETGKRMGYYHCSRKHKYIAFNKDTFENDIAKYIGRITYKKKFFGLLKEVARDVWVQKNKSNEQANESIKEHVAGLQMQQANVLSKIQTTGSDIVQKRLEEEYEGLEEIIKKAQKQKSDQSLKESEIEAYFQTLKQVMERPEKYLLAPNSKEQLQKMWRLVFSKPPTFPEIQNGTAEMSLVFRLNALPKVTKSELVGQLTLQWNLFCDETIKSLIALGLR